METRLLIDLNLRYLSAMPALQNPHLFKNSPIRIAAFSLVEVTLALGLVGFVLISLLGLFSVGLRSDRESNHHTIIPQLQEQFTSMVDFANPPVKNGDTIDLSFTQEGWTTTNQANAFYQGSLSVEKSPFSERMLLLKMTIESPGETNVSFATSVAR